VSGRRSEVGSGGLLCGHSQRSRGVAGEAVATAAAGQAVRQAIGPPNRRSTIASDKTLRRSRVSHGWRSLSTAALSRQCGIPKARTSNFAIWPRLTFAFGQQHPTRAAYNQGRITRKQHLVDWHLVPA
jgi:hypothetical protein